MDWSFRSFVHQVLPVAAKDGLAIQTMKPMGDGILLESNAVPPAECLMYALSQPVSVVIHGMEKLEHLDHALSVVKNFKPLTKPQIKALAAKAKQAAMSGKYELFKPATGSIPRRSIRSGWVEYIIAADSRVAPAKQARTRA